MDRRFSLFAAGLGVFVGVAGCTPSFLTRTETMDPAQVAQALKDSGKTPASVDKQADAPKRKPKASTCVAFGDFRLQDALTEGKAPQEKRSLLEEGRKAYQQAIEIDAKC